MDLLFILPYVGVALSLVFLVSSLKSFRKHRLICDIPTCKAEGVFIGLVELKGTAESEKPVKSFLAGAACVYYSWSIEERWSRQVTETYRDAQGKMRTRTRTESGWKTVADGGESSLFYLKDDTGIIRIAPQGAQIEADQLVSETMTPEHPWYYGKGPADAVAYSEHVRSFVEFAIPLHASIYVMGHARERKDIVAAEIAAQKDQDLFLISTRSEKQISSGMKSGVYGWGIAGLICGVGSFWFLSGSNSSRLWIFALPYVAASVLGLILVGYNSLINLRQRVRQAWSNVDVQLKRRNDLIPNLVTTVESLTRHEKEAHSAVVRLRSELEATAPGEPGPDPKGCTPLLMFLREKYPDLMSDQSFEALHANLVETEQRIALARSYFNEIATFYNTRIQSVPDCWLAALGGLREQSLMHAAEFERSPVQVELQKA